MGKISEFYNAKSILVTGATGFCGKVLVEKLLRSCEHVARIYILVRSKKEASPKERFVSYVNHFIFNTIRETDATALLKITLISGDTSVDGLQLSQADFTTLIEDVNIIFHCAANVKFVDSLKNAINNNVAGTLRVLLLAQKMKQLKVFSHMSTVASHSYQFDLAERYYPLKIDVADVIKKTQIINDTALDYFEKELMQFTKYPNTYALSKGLIEELLHSYRDVFPIVIMRPSIVWNCVSEPFEGFVEGIHSGMGLTCGGMTGLIRTMYFGNDALAKFTPADYLINATIASAWKRAGTLGDDILFFNCTDSDDNPLTWKKSVEFGNKYFPIYPPYENLLWYPKISFTSSYIWHMISLFLFQLLPAIFLDISLALAGKKRKFFTIQRKIINGISVLYYFTSHKFNFETKQLSQLFNELDADDKKKFYFDHSTIDHEQYHKKAIRQIRRLLLNEDEATLPEARKKVDRLFIADLAVKTFCTSFASYYLTKMLFW